jgi:glycosyltransferase involved in cell wall biosynthesis
MKLAIDISPLTSYPYTGIARILSNLIDSLQKKDEINIIYFALVARGHLPDLRKKYPNLKAPKIPAKLARKVLFLLQDINFPQDIITGPVDATLNIAWSCLPIRNGKTIALLADVTPVTNPEWHAKTTVETFKHRLKSIERNADLVIAISKETKKDILRTTKIQRKKIVVSYPGVPKISRKKSTKAEISRTRKELNLPESYLLFVGTQNPRKNLERLIKAFSMIDKSIRKQTKLVLAGHQEMKSSKKHQSFIVETDYVSDEHLSALYSASQGLLYPSLKEGFGLPILEAFTSETLVLTSDLSSMKEVAKDVAILINPYSAESIKNGLEKMLTMDKKTKNELLTKAKTRANKFSFEKMSRDIIKAII